MENTQKTITVTVNGRHMDVQAADLDALLAELGLEAANVVAELNGSIVPRGSFDRTELTHGDSVELVRFVGGG